MKSKRNLKLIVLFVNISLPAILLAADTVNNVGSSFDVVSYTILGIGAAVVFGGLWALFNLYNAAIFAEKVRLLKQYSPEVLAKVDIKIETESFWKKLYKKATNLVPLEKEQDIMLDHDYDGIRELDNSMPPWWLAIFYITILITPIYIWYNHYSDYALSQEQEFAEEVKRAEIAVKKYLATQADMVDENTVVAVTEGQMINVGKSIYEVNCAACHGMSGEGGIGPNMTDEYWLHGGSIKDVFKTIKYGVPEKGMISWKSQLRPADMQKIASYILTLKGTNPPNAKEPQGEKYVAEEQSDEVESEEKEDKSLGMK
jgi:cytochrome c oxidase cbb3-type subunit 3